LKLPGLGYAVAYPFGGDRHHPDHADPARRFQDQDRQGARGLRAGRNARTPRRSTPCTWKSPTPTWRAFPSGACPARRKNPSSYPVSSTTARSSWPSPHMTLAVGDVLLAVGPKEKLEELRIIVGRESNLNLKTLDTSITSKRVIVTQKSFLGATIGELAFPERFGVQITRLSRDGNGIRRAPGPAAQVRRRGPSRGRARGDFTGDEGIGQFRETIERPPHRPPPGRHRPGGVRGRSAAQNPRLAGPRAAGLGGRPSGGFNSSGPGGPMGGPRLAHADLGQLHDPRAGHIALFGLRGAQVRREVRRDGDVGRRVVVDPLGRGDHRGADFGRGVCRAGGSTK
jgi:uncharacterized protein with PhoU and TrkA domain